MQEQTQVKKTQRSSKNRSRQWMHEFHKDPTGVPLTQQRIESYLDSLAEKGRVQGTIDGYRQGMKRLYQDLPHDDKVIRRDTLRQRRERLMREGYSATAINLFIVAANGYLEYVDAGSFK